MFRSGCKLIDCARRSVKLNGHHPQRMLSSVYDPPYLDDLVPEVDLCEPFNVQITGPDYALVESYQSVVHRIAKTMGVDVAEGWATPAKKTKVVKYKPRSTVPETEYNLTHYERNIQVVDLPNNLAPILIELVQAAIPQTVAVNIRHHTELDEIERYVPDLELKQLKTELEAAGGPTKKK
uniref:39S ribosomal protein L48, mitochondrial n=1 Tax=Lygus hesperus TaxID=30085 RepID=A0A146LN78_LYGHE